MWSEKNSFDNDVVESRPCKELGKELPGRGNSKYKGFKAEPKLPF